ncbi:uncharacterized protein LOC111351948 [Spodoptera litura]|uniref:Odorant receptor n=1 Tax=Spodoptera litura TaxID=69820 RepID=A0A9J7DWR6_SPOLT|nr:uncharacterized protein LOC111351948 [Spodoptera litura]
MNLVNDLKKLVLYMKRRIQENSYDSILWLVDIVPKISGFSYRKDKVSPWFWYIHMFLLFYVYAVGNFWYQWKFAHGAGDFIKSYVNISIIVIIGNNSVWFVKQRPLLRTVLKKIEQSDELSRRSSFLMRKHEKLMKIVKRIVLIFYGFNYIDAFFIYFPHRVDLRNNYSMTPCVGLQPLTASPNREICMTILTLQEFTINIVALNYQALLLFLIAHTAAMYQMMAYEMMALNDYKKENLGQVNKKLSSLIERHCLTLDVVDNLRSLYSVPLGVNFGSNAVCISLFFYLPLRECLQFMPVFVYCSLVFFLYCFLCQRLINSAEVFARAVYCCGWENFGLKEKRLVFVMLRQSQKPVELLAADIIPVNIYTFATTLQAMFKFVTVVKF